MRQEVGKKWGPELLNPRQQLNREAERNSEDEARKRSHSCSSLETRGSPDRVGRRDEVEARQLACSFSLSPPLLCLAGQKNQKKSARKSSGEFRNDQGSFGDLGCSPRLVMMTFRITIYFPQ